MTIFVGISTKPSKCSLQRLQGSQQFDDFEFMLTDDKKQKNNAQNLKIYIIERLR
jgi:hypothetical protein